MSCYLRISRKNFDVVDYLKVSDFVDIHFYVKGQSKTPKSDPTKNKYKISGITITASDADQEDFSKQISESILFLKTNKKSIERLLQYPGVENARLDFGIERRDVFGQFDYFPPELLLLAGQLGIGIELSQYPGATQKGLKPKRKVVQNLKKKKK